MEKLITKFEAANPNIQVQFVSLDELNDLWDTDKITNAEYDRKVAELADTSSQPTGSTANWLDLTPLMHASATFNRADFYDGALSTNANGSVTSLPYQIVCNRLFAYNKTMWDAAGVAAPASDWSWNDVVTTAARLVQKGQNNRFNVYGALLSQDALADLLIDRIKSKGVTVDNLDGSAFATSGMAAALDWLKGLYDDGTLAPFHWASSLDSVEQIDKGRIGLWIAGNERWSDIDHYAFTLGLARQPVSFNGDNCYPSAPPNGNGYAISRGTHFPQAAFRWIDFLSQNQIVTRDTNNTNIVPARKSVAERTGYWKQQHPDVASVMQAVLADFPHTTSSSFSPQATRHYALYFALDKVGAAFDRKTIDKPKFIRDMQASFEENLVREQGYLTTPTPTPDPRPFAVATPVPVASGAKLPRPATPRPAARCRCHKPCAVGSGGNLAWLRWHGRAH